MRFDQVWYDEETGTVFGLTEFEDDCGKGLSVYSYTFHGSNEEWLYRGLWENETLPENGNEFGWLQYRNEGIGESVSGSNFEEILDDMTDGEEDEERFLFLDLREMFECMPAVSETLTDVTEVFRNFEFTTEEESEMDIFTKIQNLNSEIVDYINMVDDEIKRLNKEKYDILEGRHKQMYQFLLERCKLVEEMFPGKRIDVTTADGEILFRIGSCGIRLSCGPARRYINLKPSHFCTTENCSDKEKEFYNDVIANWDSIMEEVFDKHLYKELSDKMTEQVTEAKQRLADARKELEEVR